MQLRFASFVVINLRRDLHPQEYAHAGRTEKRDDALRTFPFLIVEREKSLELSTYTLARYRSTN